MVEQHPPPAQPKQLRLLDCPIDCLSMVETVAWVDCAIREGRSVQHGVVDAGKLALMYNDPVLYRSVTESDLVNGEGQLLVWLSRVYAHSLPERVVGLELFENLLELAHRRGYKVFLFGAREEVVRQVVEIASDRFSPEIIAGWRNGYYARDEEEGIARQIAESGAQMLFVAISSPKKENFMHRHAELLQGINFRMGVGGSFDVVAGRVKRAPKWMQKICLEWFFRFLQEPRDKWKVEVVDSFHFLILLLLHSLCLRRRRGA